MEIVFFAVIILTSAIQSVFGVGVLLFGTPMLLLTGLTFSEVLSTLLPLSMAINALQIAREYSYINKEFIVKLTFICVPCIVIALVFAIEIQFDLTILVGLLLILISLKFLSQKLWMALCFFLKFDKTYFVIMGLVHGATNLGGGLLTTKIFGFEATKQEKRATISSSYFIFASVQILTLLSLGELKQVNFHYLLVGITIFFIVEKFVYSKIPNKNFDYLFATFLFISGLTLMYKGVF